MAGKKFDVVKDYFKDRHAVLRLRVQVEKELTMGCPQGSVLGPTLRLVFFDPFLRMLLPGGCSLFAYADDGLLVVVTDSRRDLEDRATRACSAVLDWSRSNRLNLSVGKTEAMLSLHEAMKKGRLVGRPPIVNLGND